MVLYYAMGGGLGHLTRARAFLYSQNLERNSVIFTSSSFSGNQRVTGKIPVLTVDASLEKNPAEFQKHLLDALDKLKIEALFIDSFPLGIIKELTDLRDFGENLEINYVARLLKWKSYAPALIDGNFKFNKTFILEPLETEHQKFIEQNSLCSQQFNLKYPPVNLLKSDRKIFDQILTENSRFWLIVHAGKPNEIIELIEYADESRKIEKADVDLILISPEFPFSHKKNNLFHYNLYPASSLFEQAERIFTACGFNAMQQTWQFRDKHFFIPFERRFDDQFARAAIRNRERAGGGNDKSVKFGRNNQF